MVVGGGSSGATLAGRLSEDGVAFGAGSGGGTRVLAASTRPRSFGVVLPVSVVRADSPYQWGRARVRLTAGQPEQPYPQGRGVGGTSAINALAAIRGTPHDYDGWAAAGCEGWSWRRCCPRSAASRTTLSSATATTTAPAARFRSSAPPLDRWGSRLGRVPRERRGPGFGWADDHNDPTSTGASTARVQRGRSRAGVDERRIPRAGAGPARTSTSAEARRSVASSSTEGRATGVELWTVR